MAETRTDDIDLQAVEQRLADHGERLGRTAASLARMHWYCHIRKCRRDGACSCPMVQSERTAGALAAQKFMGLSGRAAARLPYCAAIAPGWAYEDYCDHRAGIQAILAAEPERHLPRFDRKLSGRPWPEPP